MIAIPKVAWSLFRKDYPFLNDSEARWYYKEQCSIKDCFGVKTNIKFINESNNKF